MYPVAKVLELLEETWTRWKAHGAPRIGAALAFYSLLSLAPLVILCIAAASLFFGGVTAREYLVEQARALSGNEAAAVVQGLLQQAQKPAPSLFASIVGIITLLLGASGVFGELRSALNLMWDIKPKEEGGFLRMIKEQLLSMGMVLTIGFLLVVFLVVSMVLAALGKYVDGLLPAPGWLLQSLNFVISLVAIAFLFALILRYVPDARVPWRDVSVGAAVTALLFTLGKLAISLYLGRTAVGSPYGAGGSVVVIVVWTYYSAQLFLFGAEFTKVYAHLRKSGPSVESVPASHLLNTH